MQQMSAEGTCRYKQSCHFYNIDQKNDRSARLRELYCVKWPEQCKIHQTRRTGGAVTITIWPAGRVV